MFDLDDGDVVLEVIGDLPITFVELSPDGEVLGSLPAVLESNGLVSTARFGALIGPSAAVAEDARIVALAVGGPGDSCELPRALDSDVGQLHIDTTEYFDDLDAADIGDCTGYRSPGTDVFFSFSLGTNESITVDAVGLESEDSPDVALYIIDACPAVVGSCVAGVDVFGTLGPETLTFTNPGASQTFFFVVDSFYGAGFEVDLSWDIDRL